MFPSINATELVRHARRHNTRKLQHWLLCLCEAREFSCEDFVIRAFI